jgi:hypothetical protein
MQAPPDYVIHPRPTIVDQEEGQVCAVLREVCAVLGKALPVLREACLVLR